ncbi:MAG: zinc-dependent metalloprotease [Thermoflexibacter sp.]|nr:zinc-dependent metalloprotease [Thermoflexibacter sp.]
MKTLLLSFITMLWAFVALAQLPTITEATKDYKKYEGFFNFYFDEKMGGVYLEIDKFDTEFLYVNSLTAGLGSNDIGLDRNVLGQERVVYFNRVANKVLLFQPNQNYRAMTSNQAEKRAVRESFAQSVLYGFDIEAFENGKVLVDISEFLMRDAFGAADRIRSMKQGSYRLDMSRTAMYLPRTKNFPQNTEFEATLTFVGGVDAGNFVRSVVPSEEAFTIRQHHSFVQLPDNEYTPREYDPRSSYINISYFDYSTPVSEPIDKKYAIRHRLKKKNPSAKISEAVEPIVYYLDNGTPEPIRSALLEGASWWNQAFEAAGYKDAFQVKILPEDADPMDVRYNVINWVHRSTRGWSFGNSVIDPRTGEIIKGHVTLGSLRVRQDYLIFTGLLAPFESGEKLDDKNNPMLKAALHRLKQLSAHEVGHTIGLVHNFAASVNERASVMDYPHPSISLDKNNNIDLTNVYTTGIGEWDKISIAWGYQDFPKEINEKKALDEILDNAISRGLLFISDVDARATGGSHPKAHLWDNGENAVREFGNVLQIRKKALDNFSVKNIRNDVPYALLEEVLVPIYNFHRYQTESVAKLVGGMDYSYAIRGDKQVITDVLPKETQQQALDALLQTINPEVLTLSENIIKLIPPRPQGYYPNRELFSKRTGLTFDPIGVAESTTSFSMSLLFHPERAARLIEFKARNNNLGLDDVINAVIEKTWKSQRLYGLQKSIQMQTEQIMLTHLLALSVNENASILVKSVAHQAIKNLKTWIETKKVEVKDSDYLAHLDYALDRIKVPEKAKIEIEKSMPPGAPIGMCSMD